MVMVNPLFLERELLSITKTCIVVQNTN